jgi:hypothetical protein
MLEIFAAFNPLLLNWEEQLHREEDDTCALGIRRGQCCGTSIRTLFDEAQAPAGDQTVGCS